METLILTPSKVLEMLKEHIEHNFPGKRVHSISIEKNECVVLFRTAYATVWHLKVHSVREYDLRFPLDYECVAKVNSDDLERILELTTNNTYRAWWETGNVECIKASRSTSPGDVIVLSDNKTLFLCLASGWKEYHGIPQIFNTRSPYDDDPYSDYRTLRRRHDIDEQQYRHEDTADPHQQMHRPYEDDDDLK